MNTKVIGFAITTALFGPSTLASQSPAHDSVYAVAGDTSSNDAALAAENAGGSLYGTDLPALTTDGNRAAPGLATPSRV